MSNVFEFGTCSFKFLLLILFPIASICYGQSFKKTFVNSHPFSDMLFKIIAKLCTGLLYIIPKMISKQKTNSSEPSSKYARLFIILIGCLGVVDFIRLFFYDFPFVFAIEYEGNNATKPIVNEKNVKEDTNPQSGIKIFLENLDMLFQMICIILAFFLSQKFLRIHFGSYLKLSLRLITIGSVLFIIYCIIWLIQNMTPANPNVVNPVSKLNWEYILTSLISIFLTNILRCIIEVLEKYLMNKFFVNSFLITTVEGIIGMILFICFMFIGGTEYWKTLFSSEIYRRDLLQPLFTIICIIFQLLKETFRIQLNYQLSPVHGFGADIISSFVMIFFQMNDDKKWFEIILIVFGTCFAFIGFAELCEIIIIKICGYGEDTQESLANRGADEQTELQKDLEIVQNESDEED